MFSALMSCRAVFLYSCGTNLIIQAAGEKYCASEFIHLNEWDFNGGSREDGMPPFVMDFRQDKSLRRFVWKFPTFSPRKLDFRSLSGCSLAAVLWVTWDCDQKNYPPENISILSHIHHYLLSRACSWCFLIKAHQTSLHIYTHGCKWQ